MSHLIYEDGEGEVEQRRKHNANFTAHSAALAALSARVDESLSLTDAGLTIAGNRLTAEQSAQVRGALGNFTIKIPDLLGWNATRWPVALSVDKQNPSYPVGDVGLSLRGALTLLHPGWEAWQALYVDVSMGSNGSGTIGSPFNTIGNAQAAANSSGNPARIFVKGGTVATREKGFSNNGSVSLGVDAVYIAYGGRCVVGTHDDLTWSISGTQTNCSTAARSSVVNVVDLVDRKSNATYPVLKKVATAAICNRTPGSWWTDNVNILVNRADGEAASNANTRAYLNVTNIFHNGTTQRTCVLLAETAADGFDIEGGGPAGCWYVSYSGNVGARTVLVGAELSTFRYGGGATGGVGNVGINGINGLAFFDRCDASSGASDLFNWHNTAHASVGAEMHVITVNCSGMRSGLLTGYTSCNGSTSHDDKIHRISLCDRYYACRGATVHDIGNSRSLIAYPVLGGSYGDYINGVSVPPTEVRANGTTLMWLIDPVWAGMPSGFPRIVAGDTATIYYSGVDLKTINAAVTATVVSM